MSSEEDTLRYRGNSNVTDEQKSSMEEESDELTTKHKKKLWRHNSVSNVESVSLNEKVQRRKQSDRPIHEPRDSLLSMSSGFYKFEGLVNNAMLILVLGGSRLLLENVIKYGVRANPVDWLLYVLQQGKQEGYFHTPLWLLLSNIHLLLEFHLEKLLSKRKVASTLGWYLHVAHLVVIIVLPWAAFYLRPACFSLMGRMLICTVHTLLFLKLWSYAQVNHWCRDARHKARKQKLGRSVSFRHPDTQTTQEVVASGTVSYPDNLTLRDLYYFMLAPTLCYELNFPRTDRIRKWFLLRRVVEVVFLSNLVLASFQQFIIPSVKNSMKPFSEMDMVRTWERLLKLALPNHLLWVVWFYLMFHSLLNTIGELMMFADRKFYGAWWNAQDVGTFWRLWNLPVHHWAVRHLYLPVVKAGYGKSLASFLVFVLSAFLHEYLVSVPLCMHKVLVFLGMLMQVPLISVSERVSRHCGWQYGNLMLWASLILGQPLGMLTYFHDYAIQNLDFSQM